ncbi:MAG: quinol dehydrogenase [Gammaproteobacteria bacterium (ex Lamellibrachia satsuma)]|nr:MAG: ferredoxin-type protein NapG [Gammaproteobacteria bacterium (ex Lamellibrachia satsuma)]RRS35936.1 MAG: quinol dehydrogenase [Gammaproteobacteria bacterium (ex Lamellibrachia satsuma)]RRS36528.1 MAG: quinol dehydrogenase [Gammaproteobacteria bacterium (ex Lamellibrachia satsuma)]
MSDTDKKHGMNRRQFLGNMLKTACGVGLVGMGLGIYSNRASSLPAHYLRPPGALPEEDFLGACIRCGLCVRDCPYDMLFLGEVGDDVATGTPYFVARTGPCEMCEDIPCIAACPTNALDHGLTDIEESRMGLAVVVDQETCIAFHGLRCEVCFNVCPIRGRAITLDLQHNVRSGKHALFIPVVHSDACTGCGLCERACILDEAAIKVFPTDLAKGELGKHYRLGWKEKEKAGKALVTPDIEHKYNLPEGVRYDLQGEGLIIEEKPEETPFSSNPLDSLNSSFMDKK